MTVVLDPALDETDWKLPEALQADARRSYTALGECVGLSRPAVAERVRRLEELGVITGYRAVVDPARLGLGITAFIRMSTNTRSEATAGRGAGAAARLRQPDHLDHARRAGEPSSLCQE